MEAAVAAILFKSLELAIQQAPKAVEAIREMFNKGPVTVEMVREAQARNNALTLDDVEVPQTAKAVES